MLGILFAHPVWMVELGLAAVVVVLTLHRNPYKGGF